MTAGAPAGLYVHIPFCAKKCAYCDFASYPGLEALHGDYVAAVAEEARAAARPWAGTAFDTLFFGGGTPTTLSPEALGGLLAALRGALDLTSLREASIEANPGTVDAAGLAALRRAGFDRLSLGVQSLHDDELALLGRVHSAAEALEAAADARRAGFANLSLDLIYGLPGQRVARWRETLARALEVRPEHLSLYALTLEECTPLAVAVERGELPAPDDEAAAEMYEHAEVTLAEAGYTHYEISNWALARPSDPPDAPALACQHNLKYWRNERYLGLGAAATSYDGARRYTNTPSPARYIARVQAAQPAVADEETLDAPGRMGETMMLGLRLMAGVEREAFARRFGRTLEEAYGPTIARLVEDGLLEADARGIRLTPRGRLLGNRVFAEFLP